MQEFVDSPSFESGEARKLKEKEENKYLALIKESLPLSTSQNSI
jgi:hypothetical protein